MFISWAKKKTDKQIPRKSFRVLYSWGFTPNRLTFLSAVFKVLAGYFFYTGMFMWGGFAIIFDYFFDFLDGGIARHLNKTTKRGAIYDFLADRVLREGWIIALAFGGWISFELALIVVLVDAFSYFFHDYAELNKLKQIDWLPANHKFVVYGAFLGHMPLFLMIGIVVNAIFTVTNVVSLIVLNKEERDKE
ncbi:CDP-alcohol phosphatidyltransferase family protein [Patescibacteria group bacterium]|nr:CDP-alcohol phosphatidyltransferase family protein [Patescibacteria group bacterium]